MTQFELNGKTVTTQTDATTALIWALRDEFGLSGTTFGCSVRKCGACTIQVDGKATLACATTIGDIAGRSVTTIEGLDADKAAALFDAWDQANIPRCNYCQPGQFMRVASIMSSGDTPGGEAIAAAMQPNPCRCDAAPSIVDAMVKALGAQN